MSEYLRCAPKYTISRLNNQKFSGEALSHGEGTPLLAFYPLSTFGTRHSAPRFRGQGVNIFSRITPVYCVNIDRLSGFVTFHVFDRSALYRVTCALRRSFGPWVYQEAYNKAY